MRNEFNKLEFQSFVNETPSEFYFSSKVPLCVGDVERLEVLAQVFVAGFLCDVFDADFVEVHRLEDVL